MNECQVHKNNQSCWNYYTEGKGWNEQKIEIPDQKKEQPGTPNNQF